MKLMGIDYGTKRVGVAVSDDAGRIAFPHQILPSDKNLINALKELCEKERVGAVVIGESRDYKQKENPIMDEVRSFAEKFSQKTGLPVHFEPEFLTSVEARRAPGKMPKTRKRKAPKKTDAHAAAIILQSYIDRIMNHES